MGRNITIDIAKAICIIFVVIGHYLPDDSPQWYQSINDIVYSFHMPLFFFASGYIYISTLKKCSYTSFISKKVKRLVIPYFATSIILISIKLLTEFFSGMQVDHPVGINAFIRMFYLPEAGFFLWFIWALWWMFVIVPLFKTKTQRNVLFALTFVCAYIPFPTTEIFCLAELKDMFVYFMLGVFVYENHLVKYITKISSTAIVLTFIILEGLYVGGILDSIIVWFLPYLGIVSFMLLSRRLANSNLTVSKTRMIAVAEATYIIYLFHTTFEGLVKSSLHMVSYFANGANDMAFAIGALIVISVGLFGPILLYRYVLNKNKVFKFLFGLK